MEETDGRHGMRRKYAMEEMVLSQGGYKKACFSLCSFLISLSSLHPLSVHLVFYLLSKSLVTAYDLIIFSCFFDNFSQPKLFVPIKVPHRQVTGISIRCA